jgi:hypothetical protein
MSLERPEEIRNLQKKRGKSARPVRWAGRGNGTLPHGPSHRALPRLYKTRVYSMHREVWSCSGSGMSTRALNDQVAKPPMRLGHRRRPGTRSPVRWHSRHRSRWAGAPIAKTGERLLACDRWNGLRFDKAGAKAHDLARECSWVAWSGRLQHSEWTGDATECRRRVAASYGRQEPGVLDRGLRRLASE